MGGGWGGGGGGRAKPKKNLFPEKNKEKNLTRYSAKKKFLAWKISQQLGNLLSLCREIAGARDIFHTSGISTYDFAFLRRRSRKLNCRENFTNISSMESIYIINILIVD